jgi:hypothetical protein
MRSHPFALRSLRHIGHGIPLQVHLTPAPDGLAKDTRRPSKRSNEPAPIALDRPICIASFKIIAMPWTMPSRPFHAVLG